MAECDHREQVTRTSGTRVVIVGGGVIGLTAAWFLERAGCHVTVVDRARGPCLETSFANAGLLTPSMADPWNAPGMLRILLRSLRDESPVRLRPLALLSYGRWGLRFIRNSSRERFLHATRRNLRLAVHSLSCLESLSAVEPRLGFTRGHGTLKVFRSRATYETSLRTLDLLAAEGLRFQRLTPQGLAEIEPQLAGVAEQLAGAVHFPDDGYGDAFGFGVGLASCLRRRGMELRFGCEVIRVLTRGRNAVGVATTDETYPADAVVIAAGVQSLVLGRRLGIRLPVAPVKGYSISLGFGDGVALPSIAVVDEDLHAAATPLGNILRAAGTAEFAGNDTCIRDRRIANLVELVRRIYPRLLARADSGATRSWAGLRPMSCDGVPIVSATAIQGLFVSAGHGHLGWTMAAGSGDLLRDLVLGRETALPALDYSLDRQSL